MDAKIKELKDSILFYDEILNNREGVSHKRIIEALYYRNKYSRGLKELEK